jgi:hypothetical protein
MPISFKLVSNLYLYTNQNQPTAIKVFSQMRKIILLLFILPMQLFAQGTWKRMADFPVTNRSGDDKINSFVIDGKLYVFLIRNQPKITEVWEFSPNLNTWTKKNNFIGPFQQYPFCVGIGSKGYYGLGNEDSLALWEYEPKTDTWTSKGVPSNFISGTRSFTIGGKGYFAMTEWSIWVYNPDSNSWRESTRYPTTPAAYPIIFTIGDIAYIGGGYKNQWHNNDFYSFDPKLNQWKKKNGLPNEYFWQSFSICQNAYGIDNTKDKFYRYSYGTDTWTMIGKRPKMNPYVSVSIGKKGYMGLGEDSLNITTNILWEFTPGDSCTQFSSIEETKAIDFSLSPNPLSTESYLHLNSSTNETFTFNLYQSNGLLVRTEIGIANEPLKITKAGLANGLYFYQISMGSKQAVGKLVLE